jgi:predicted membrane protein
MKVREQRKKNILISLFIIFSIIYDNLSEHISQQKKQKAQNKNLRTNWGCCSNQFMVYGFGFRPRIGFVFNLNPINDNDYTMDDS